MKTVFHPNQFFNQNEPWLMSLLGNISLLVAFISTLPELLMSQGITNIPTGLITISHYCIVAGVFLKMVSNFFGTVDYQKCPIQTTIPSIVKKQEDNKPLTA